MRANDQILLNRYSALRVLPLLFCCGLLSGCTTHPAIKAGLEVPSYVDLGWMRVVDNDTAKRSGFKRLQVEMQFRSEVRYLVERMGLPDYVQLPPRSPMSFANFVHLNLAYLDKGVIYQFSARPAPPREIRSSEFEGLPENVAREFWEHGYKDTAAAQKPTSGCIDDTVPQWWANYRVDGLKRGKLTGAGSEQRKIQEEAETAATATANRELSAWLNRKFFAVATWYATKHERSNPQVTSQRVLGLVEALLEEYVAESRRSRVESFLRCDGQFEAYVLVEIPAGEVSSEVTRRVIEELSGAQAYRSAAVVRELEEKLSGELMELIAKKPEVPVRPAPEPAPERAPEGAQEVVQGGGASSRELEAYRSARAAWSEGDAEVCIDRFRNFLQTYASSTYAENASYWMADCYFKRGDYKTAVLRFDDVVARYPTGERAPDALYRQGEALLHLGPGYGRAAGKAFERVIQEYPDSARTPEAKKQLELLGSG